VRFEHDLVYFSFCRLLARGLLTIHTPVDPKQSYNQVGYAAAAVELLHDQGVKEVIVLGWSLGGHIGMEMLELFPGVKGLMSVKQLRTGH
jgi:pimeloyl-ACP methyl ester carboxylesterase